MAAWICRHTGVAAETVFVANYGQSFQRQPVFSTCRMPLITRRSSTLRAPGWFFGRCGSISAHASG